VGLIAQFEKKRAHLFVTHDLEWELLKMYEEEEIRVHTFTLDKALEAPRINYRNDPEAALALWLYLGKRSTIFVSALLYTLYQLIEGPNEKLLKASISMVLSGQSRSFRIHNSIRVWIRRRSAMQCSLSSMP
jgi:hypothetical protein